MILLPMFIYACVVGFRSFSLCIQTATWLTIAFQIGIIMLFSFSVHADTKCPVTERQYILGNYKKCSTSKEGTGSTRCDYIRALCNMGNGNMDEAKYSFSMLSTVNTKQEKFSGINGLALASLVEMSYLNGEYKKARELSGELNSLLSKKLPDSYPYLISEVLLAKSYYDDKDSASAMKRINMLKNANVDPLLYCSINP